MRADGRPSGVDVASVAASGSNRSASLASASHRARTASGSSPSSSSHASTYANLLSRGSDTLRAVAATRTIEIRTEIPGPRSRAIAEREERVIAHPLLVHLPIFAERAENATITDVDGNVFVDFAGGVG